MARTVPPYSATKTAPLPFTTSAVGRVKRAFVPTALVAPEAPLLPASVATAPAGEIVTTVCAFVTAAKTVALSAPTATPCTPVRPDASVVAAPDAPPPALGVAHADGGGLDREGGTLAVADLAADGVAAGEHVGLEDRPVPGHSAGHEQGVAAPAPAGQKEPAGQMVCVAEVEPRGQK